MGNRTKIGIIVLDNKIKDRLSRKTNFFDSLEYAGIKFIISEINKKYELKYIAPPNINTVDFAIISLISYYDIINFVKAFHNQIIQSKIIVGGAGVLNIRLYKNLIYAACFGRGETLINDILEGKEVENVWYNTDMEFKKIYKIGQKKHLIQLDNYKENNVGCINACFFCQYKWKHETPKVKNYNSGQDDSEDMFLYFKWKNAEKRVITAIDGTMEITRKLINKPLSNQEITEKLIQSYQNRAKNVMYVKVFNIVGYPWENKELNFNELIKAVKAADKRNKEQSVWLKLSLNHFKPMPLTPMENEPVNLINFRELLLKNNRLYIGNNFELTLLPYAASPITALEETLINRAYEKNYDNFVKVILSKKYMQLNSKKKIDVILKYFGEGIAKYTENLPTNYIQHPYSNFSKIKQKYYDKKMKQRKGI